MAAPRYSVSFQNSASKKFFSEILSNVDKIHDKAPVYVRSIIMKNVIKDVETHFDEQDGGPRIGPWAEWSSAYLDHMRKAGKQGNNILRDNGRLSRGVRSNNFRLNSKSITIFNNQKTRKGFPYAAAHNDGGPILPRRRFMWLSKVARENIAKQSLQFMLGKPIT